jgi:hypothetical protein
MTNRTVQIKGYGFGSTPAEITVALEGTTVYTGTVTTTDATPPTLPNLVLTPETVTLCTFNIPIDFAGEKAMTCSVSNGTVIFAQIDANYTPIPNPIFSEADLSIITNTALPISERVNVLATYASPPFTAEEIATLESTDPALAPEQQAIMVAHGVSFTVSSGAGGYYDINTGSDSRGNVVIDGTPVTPDHSPDYEGTWWWRLAAGSTMSYNMIVDPGLE